MGDRKVHMGVAGLGRALTAHDAVVRGGGLLPGAPTGAGVGDDVRDRGRPRDPRAALYLYQRFSLAIQRGNTLCLLGSFSATVHAQARRIQYTP